MPGEQLSEEDLKNMSPEQIAELQKQNCIFCKIIKGEIPSKKVYEDSKTFCVLDINPATEGHILILPKDHYQIMPQIPDDVIGHLFAVSKALSKACLSGLGVKGTNIFVANGAIAGQKAPHFMIHVIPRNEGDGIGMEMPKFSITDEQVDKVKQRLLPKLKEVFGKEMPAEGAAPVAPKEDKPGKEAEKGAVKKSETSQDSDKSEEKSEETSENEKSEPEAKTKEPASTPKKEVESEVSEEDAPDQSLEEAAGYKEEQGESKDPDDWAEESPEEQAEEIKEAPAPPEEERSDAEAVVPDEDEDPEETPEESSESSEEEISDEPKPDDSVESDDDAEAEEDDSETQDESSVDEDVGDDDEESPPPRQGADLDSISNLFG